MNYTAEQATRILQEYEGLIDFLIDFARKVAEIQGIDLRTYDFEDSSLTNNGHYRIGFSRFCYGEDEIELIEILPEWLENPGWKEDCLAYFAEKKRLAKQTIDEKQAAFQASIERVERAQYEKLKAKYGDN